MGPDRSVMVRHRVITRFLCGHSANSPPGKRCFVSECRRYATRALVTRNSSEKAVTCGGGAHAASLFVSIKCYGKRCEVVTPESLIKMLTQFLGLANKPLRPRVIAETSGQSRCRKLSGIHVALHLA